MAVATCLLSVPLTVWVVSRSHAERITLTAVGAAAALDAPAREVAVARWSNAALYDTPVYTTPLDDGVALGALLEARWLCPRFQ
jgi:hypothetical protein